MTLRTEAGPIVAGIPIVVRVPTDLPFEPRRRPQWKEYDERSHEPLVLDYEVDPTLHGLARDGEHYYVDPTGLLAYEGHPAGQPCTQRMRTVRAGYHHVVQFGSVADMNDWEWMWKRRLFLYALAVRGIGLALHAGLFLLADGRAVAIPGVSGAGKSTLARLLQQQADALGVRVLCDDRVALTIGPGGSVRAWSTPWYSRAGIATPGVGALAAMVLPHHGAGAQLRPMTSFRATQLLLRTLAVPFWEEGLAAESLGRMDAIVQRAPAWEFSYAPTAEEAAQLLPALLHALDDAPRGAMVADS